MTVYLLRHGVTAYNREKRYQGTRDIPLSPEGKAALSQPKFAPERVYVSPLTRARETAAIWFPSAEQIVVPELRELGFGDFEGRNYIEMEHDDAYRSWVDGGCMESCPGGENRTAFLKRTKSAFCHLVEGAMGQSEPLVIVAHGGVQMSVLSQLAAEKRSFWDWCGPNAGGYVLTVTPERWAAEHTVSVMETVVYTKEQRK